MSPVSPLAQVVVALFLDRFSGRRKLVVDQNLVDCRIEAMPKTLPISEVKTHLPELVTDVADGGEAIVVTRHGRPAAVLVGYEKYRRQKETLDILCDPDMMKQIRQSRRFYARRAQGVSFADVFRERQ